VNLEHVVVSENDSQISNHQSVDIADDSVGHLSFCDVEIKGISRCVQALDDLGTQMNLVNPKVIDGLDFPRFGKVVVSG